MSVVQDPPTATAGAPPQHDLHQTKPAESAVLITSNEVVFATAAAKGLSREDDRWSLLRRIISVLAFTASDAAAQDDSRPRYRPIIRRLTYLDDARLEREMLRL